MPDLIAQGPERRQRWRRRLDGTAPVLLGRDCGVWSVPWDPCISRTHATLAWNHHRLRVDRIASSSNPIFFQGHAVNSARLTLGQHFVIGETRFTWVDHSAQVSLVAARPADQRTFSGEYLRQVQFRNAHQQIQALTRLPEVVASAQTEGELYPRVIHLLLTGMTRAQAAAIVDCGTAGDASMQVLSWDRLDSTGPPFQPNGPLIRQAITTSENVVHVWRRGAGISDSPSTETVCDQRPRSISDGSDWAICVPIPGMDCRGHVLYVAGVDPDVLSDDDSLQDILKFIELLATTVGNVCDVRRLQKQTTALAQFFSPPVRDAVAANDPETVLAPRETEVSVLFCDLRGFSLRSEKSASDLFELLRRVSEALGIATHEILETGGVIGDFHGDAAMGFWGWPIANPHCVQQASGAALRIKNAFEQASTSGDSALNGFHVGMGLATGQAVAGKIGTTDQVKVTAFGPVVNLAARLEGMTRLFELPILTDETTASRLQQAVPATPTSTNPLVRRLPRVQPYGMASEYRLFTLLDDPPASTVENSEQQIQNRNAYEMALNAFESGDWSSALKRLGSQPETDRVAASLTAWIHRLGPQAPSNWAGVIRLDRK